MKRVFFVFMIFIGLAVGASAQKDRHIEAGLVELVNNIDQKSGTIQTARAHFKQRKEISLLTEPVETEGTFSLKRNGGMRFDFQKKDDLILILGKEEVVSLSPQAKTAARIKIKKRKTELTTGILSENLGTLLDYFNLTRASGAEGNHLVLTPIKRKHKKKFKDLQLWVNNEFLIYKIKVTLADGDIYELLLTDIELNIALEDSLFDTAIPPDFEQNGRMESIFGNNIAL